MSERTIRKPVPVGAGQQNVPAQAVPNDGQAPRNHKGLLPCSGQFLSETVGIGACGTTRPYAAGPGWRSRRHSFAAIRLTAP
jgi:hypothetical protein